MKCKVYDIRGLHSIFKEIFSVTVVVEEEGVEIGAAVVVAWTEDLDVDSVGEWEDVEVIEEEGVQGSKGFQKNNLTTS